jgi:hypothetical protein
VKLTGILSVSNASSLGYPFVSVAKNLAEFCDEVLVGVDPTFPADRVLLSNIDKVNIVDSVWDRGKMAAGEEIAYQMDKLISMVNSDWVVVLQADEFIHQESFGGIRYRLSSAFTSTTGFSMERLYFWKDLETIRSDWQARLVRIFRPGTYSFLSEDTDRAGMYSGQTKFGLEVALDDPFYIYHYSRVGAPEVISRRVRNLDSFFHAEEDLVPSSDLPSYDFVPRKYDNYLLSDSPPAVEGKFTKFTGTHPGQVMSYYGAK